MTSHVGRLYALAGALLVFFVLWASIAAHPWRSAGASSPDSRIAALAAREQRIHAESLRVKRLVDRRFAAYRRALARREAQIARVRSQRAVLAAASARAATPAVAQAPRIVTLPPVTVTRTS